jgi:cobalt-zinc-cadmium efflux system membrane fusion protein
MAAKFGLAVASAGPAVIREAVEVFGTVQADPARSWSVQARFPGVVRSVAVQQGDRVTAGDELALVESDESLKSYRLTSPASGVLVERMANAGEQTAGRTLFRILDQAEVWAMFRVFPAARAKVQLGQMVYVHSAAGEKLAEGAIDWIALEAAEDQSVLARVVLANPDGSLLPGMHLSGTIRVASHAVDLAVKRSGLQQFRDFTVVYRRIGELYEVRMLELGRQDEEWVEVLGGLNAGDIYVTENSYLVKADIDKDSAAHDH